MTLKEPHVIQTIPRKGYRLVLQVRPVRRKAHRRYVIGSLVLLAMLGIAIAATVFSAIRPRPFIPLQCYP